MMIARDNIETKDECHPEFTVFTINCDSRLELDKHEMNHIKSAPVR
jgi:hypothetical protein